MQREIPLITITVVLAASLIAGWAFAGYSIPVEKVELTKILYGSSDAFEKPGEVRFDDVIKATPEYSEVRDNKIERGTGRYWVLLSQASDRANRTITQVGDQSDYDLIVVSEYLDSLDPAIPADDITALVIETMQKSAGKN